MIFLAKPNTSGIKTIKISSAEQLNWLPGQPICIIPSTPCILFNLEWQTVNHSQETSQGWFWIRTLSSQICVCSQRRLSLNSAANCSSLLPSLLAPKFRAQYGRKSGPHSSLPLFCKRLHGMQKPPTPKARSIRNIPVTSRQCGHGRGSEYSPESHPLRQDKAPDLLTVQIPLHLPPTSSPEAVIVATIKQPWRSVSEARTAGFLVTIITSSFWENLESMQK